MNEKEQRIKELRTLEANKKNYMGMTGKFGAILKAFGEPIIKQNAGGGWFDATYLEDPMEPEKEDPRTPEELLDFLPSGDRESHAQPDGPEWHNRESEVYDTQIIGYRFDGLSRGNHLEIVFWDLDSKIRVSFKGHPVYQETMGDLERFVPYEEWENKIESLYEQAKEVLFKKKQEFQEDQRVVKEKEKTEWLTKMKEIWGL